MSARIFSALARSAFASREILAMSRARISASGSASAQCSVPTKYAAAKSEVSAGRPLCFKNSSASSACSSPAQTTAASAPPQYISRRVCAIAHSNEISFAVAALFSPPNFSRTAIADGTALCTEFVNAVGMGSASRFSKTFSTNASVCDVIPSPVPQQTAVLFFSAFGFARASAVSAA